MLSLPGKLREVCAAIAAVTIQGGRMRSHRGLAGLLLSGAAIALILAPLSAIADPPGHESEYEGNTLVVGSGGGKDLCRSPAYSSIQAAVTAAFPGDTITVCPGTYNEDVSVTTSSLTIRGLAGAVVKPSAGSNGFFVRADHVTVRGLEIDGSNGANYGIFYYNAHDGKVIKNVVHDIANSAEDVAGVGILFWGDTGAGMDDEVIEDNRVYNTARMGIFLGAMTDDYSAYILSTKDAIVRNEVHNTWQGPTSDFGAAIQINGGKGFSIDDNNVHRVILSNGFYAGIYVYGSVGGAIKGNNVNQANLGIVVWAAGSGRPAVDFGSSTPSAPAISRNNAHDIYRNSPYDGVPLIWVV